MKNKTTHVHAQLLLFYPKKSAPFFAHINIYLYTITLNKIPASDQKQKYHEHKMHKSRDKNQEFNQSRYKNKKRKGPFVNGSRHGNAFKYART